jgi:hypothetical protein
VVGIFFLGAGETCSRGAEAMAKPAFVGWETLLPGKPAKNFALQRGSTPPNLVSKLINLQMPERIDIDTLVRELFVSEAVIAVIRGVATQDHKGELICKGTKVGLRGQREARSKGTMEVRCQSRGDIDVDASGMGVEIRKAVLKSGVTSPEVSPEGRGGAVADRNFGDSAENHKTSDNVFPNMGVQVVCVPK